MLLRVSVSLRFDVLRGVQAQPEARPSLKDEFLSFFGRLSACFRWMAVTLLLRIRVRVKRCTERVAREGADKEG
jgi:hypothetical protein